MKSLEDEIKREIRVDNAIKTALDIGAITMTGITAVNLLTGGGILRELTGMEDHWAKLCTLGGFFVTAGLYCARATWSYDNSGGPDDYFDKR